MKDIIHLEAPSTLQKSLAEQRLDLRLRLQLNRRLLVHKFSDEQAENHFPRSTIMRFLTQQTTLHILKKLAFTAIGIKTFKSLQYGFTFAQFLRSRLAASKEAS
jgi:hypothetical protein